MSSKPFLAIIFYHVGCPVHEDLSYSKLEFFDDLESIIDWQGKHLGECLITEIYNLDTQERTEYQFDESCHHHNVDFVTLYKNNIPILKLRRDPHDTNKYIREE